MVPRLPGLEEEASGGGGERVSERKNATKEKPFPRSPALPLTLSLWLPVLAWAGLIFYFSSLPDLRITEAWWDILARKAAHLFVFGVLARLLARAFVGSTYWPWKKIFAWSLVGSFLYACSDETHQIFVTGRAGSAIDVFIDTLGAWLALGLRP